MKLVVFWSMIGCFLGCVVQAESSQIASLKIQAEEIYQAAVVRFDLEHSSVVDAWNLARVAFDLGEYLEPSDMKENVAKQGIAASRFCIKKSPELAEGHYYLALNLGQLARCRKLSALKLVREMEKAFMKARDLNPALDFAGPDRCLGRLYLQAPGWPASIGSSRKAMHHLTEALRIHPEFPGNALQLVHACQSLKQHDEAHHYYRITHQITHSMNEKWSDRLPPIVLIKWDHLLKDIESSMPRET